MIKKRMVDALNKQINEEGFSSYLYLSMVTYFEMENLKGFAHWFRNQVQEEMFHMMKFYNYILERGGEPVLGAIEKPKFGWDSALQLFEEGLAHERHITECIDNLMDVAIEEKDHATRNLLNWFVDEQVEEEDQFTEILEKLKMIGDNKAMLLMLDNEMGSRQPGPSPYFPAPEGE